MRPGPRGGWFTTRNSKTGSRKAGKQLRVRQQHKAMQQSRKSRRVFNALTAGACKKCNFGYALQRCSRTKMPCRLASSCVISSGKPKVSYSMKASTPETARPCDLAAASVSFRRFSPASSVSENLCGHCASGAAHDVSGSTATPPEKAISLANEKHPSVCPHCTAGSGH